MNSEIVPALVAAGGGGALLAGIAAHEHRQRSRMRRSRRAFRVTFPAGVTETAARSALAALAGLDHRVEIVAEIVADVEGVQHLLRIPVSVAAAIGDQLTAALPGLRLEEVDSDSSEPVAVAVRITVGRRALLRTDDPEGGSRTLLSAFGALREDDRLSLRWALRPGVPPIASGSGIRRRHSRLEPSNEPFERVQGNPVSKLAGCCSFGPPQRRDPHA